MTSQIAPQRERRPVAAYARSFPADTCLMETYRSSMADLAVRHGLPEPSFFEDNGFRATDVRPGLSCLLDLVAAGIFRAVLIPGPFVLGNGRAEARVILGRIRTAGCEVMELDTAD